MNSTKGSKTKKIIMILFMSALTGTTMTACNWQLGRYYQAKSRWDLIDNQFKSFQPEQINLQQIPWNKQNMNNWEYKFVTLTGVIQSKRYLITRAREGRYGYLVLAPLVSGDKGIIINLGWIPKEMKEQVEGIGTSENQQKKEIQTQIITGIVRKPEEIDYLHQNVSQEILDKQQTQTFIDLQKLVDIFNLKNKDQANIAFIEKLVGDEESGEENNLYPVASTRTTYIKPYLTPQKHLDYATFWASASIVGVLTLFHIAFRW